MNEFWSIKLDVVKLLNVTTGVTLIGLIIFLSYGLTKFENPPSVSAIIALNRETTVSFAILVLLHGYSVMAYLVILSAYYGLNSWYFRGSVIACAAYIFALIVLSYLPLDRHTDPHDVVAAFAFFLAALSSIIHKPGFIVKKEYKEDIEILSVEVFFLIALAIFGSLFWFNNSMLSEYIFMGLLVIDKAFKIYVLQVVGLVQLSGAHIKYSFQVPQNVVTNF